MLPQCAPLHLLICFSWLQRDNCPLNVLLMASWDSRPAAAANAPLALETLDTAAGGKAVGWGLCLSPLVHSCLTMFWHGGASNLCLEMGLSLTFLCNSTPPNLEGQFGGCLSQSCWLNFLSHPITTLNFYVKNVLGRTLQALCPPFFLIFPPQDL